MTRAWKRFLANAIINGLHRNAARENKPIVSSALASQIFRKEWAIQIFQQQELIWYGGYETAQRTTVKVCAHVVSVSVKLSRNKLSGGFSQFISMSDFIEALKVSLTFKAEEVKVHQRLPTIWVAEDSLGLCTISLRDIEKPTCNCKLWKCLNNRIFKRSESPYLLKLMCLDELFQGRAICHHIMAAQEAAKDPAYPMSKARSSRPIKFG